MITRWQNERRNDELPTRADREKLDQVTELLLQTQAQELRLTTVEKGLSDFIKEYNRKKDKATDRWLTPLITTLVSVGTSTIITLILVKVGLK